MIIKIDDKKWFIREDIRTGFYIENGDVFAVPLQEDGEPHDDEGVTTNVDELFFDLSQEDIGKLKHMICMILSSQNGPIIAALRKLDNDNKNR